MGCQTILSHLVSTFSTILQQVQWMLSLIVTIQGVKNVQFWIFPYAEIGASL